MDPATIYEAVNSRYGATARSSSSLTNPKYSQTVAQAFGYSAEDLASIPQEANLGVSCGNPLALANLREGETVIDLGSGAGFDVFLAARKVGEKGRAVGVDMNEVCMSINSILKYGRLFEKRLVLGRGRDGRDGVIWLQVDDFILIMGICRICYPKPVSTPKKQISKTQNSFTPA